MQDEQNLNRSENELMEALSGLAPEPPAISEQAIWFQAGLRAGQRRIGVWRGIAAAAIVAAGGFIAWHPNPTAVYVDRVQPAPQSNDDRGFDGSAHGVRSVASIDYLRIRDAVEQNGADALPKAIGSGVLSQPTQSAWSPLSTDSAPGLWDSLTTKG
jgi:hypothetical protein